MAAEHDHDNLDSATRKVARLTLVSRLVVLANLAFAIDMLYLFLRDETTFDLHVVISIAGNLFAVFAFFKANAALRFARFQVEHFKNRGRENDDTSSLSEVR